jgi:anti-sigma factor RsiW
MNDNLQHIFSDTGCPSHERLLDYSRGLLTGEERHRIETHLVDCEMCSDELEGLSLMKDPSRLGEIVKEIQAGIDERRSRVVRMRIRTVALAAAALLLLSIGTVVTFRLLAPRTSPPAVAEAPGSKEEKLEQLPPGTSPPGVAEPVRAVQPEKQGKRRIAGNIPRESPSAKPVTTVPVMEPVASGAALAEKDQLVIAPSAVRNDTFATGKAEEVREAALEQAPASESRSKKGAVYETVSPTPVAEQMKSAMNYFNLGQYFQASGIFERILSAQPANMKALYYSALCYYHMKDPARASRRLEKILADPLNEYFPEAGILSQRIRAEADSARVKLRDSIP